uniref:Uncharacterized protein n=1 Tax=Oryza glumipatula TaxID=40148 RepID=A0A0E0B885_9ORYZ
MAATAAQPRLDPDHPRWIWPGGGRPSRMRRDDASSYEAASGGREGYGGGVGGADVGAVEGSVVRVGFWAISARRSVPLTTGQSGASLLLGLCVGTVGCHRQDRVRGGQVARLGERHAEAVWLCRRGTARRPGYGGRGQARRGCRLARQCGYGSDPTRMVMAQPSGVVAGRGAVEQRGPAVRRRGMCDSVHPAGGVVRHGAVARCGTATGMQWSRLTGLFDLVFSPDGRLIASVSNETGLRLVQPVFTSKTARGHFGTFNALSFSSSARNNKIMEGVSSS